MAASAELAVPVIERPLYIGGAWRAATAAPIRVLDPTLEEPLADVPSATAAEVHAALESAHAAQAAWARTSTVERGMHLRAIADLVAAHRDQLEALLVSEVGKPASQAAGELEFTESLLRYNAEWDRRLAMRHRCRAAPRSLARRALRGQPSYRRSYMIGYDEAGPVEALRHRSGGSRGTAPLPASKNIATATAPGSQTPREASPT